MAKARLERTVRQSVLDRLIDRDPRRGDPTLTWEQSVSRLKFALLRDLEWLLNTRQTVAVDEELPPEVERSVYTYGLPDISSMSASDPDTHRRLIRHVEETIDRFEPRLSGVRAALVDNTEGGKQEIHILIEATLEMDPNPERVAFDTVLDISSGQFKVQDRGHA